MQQKKLNAELEQLKRIKNYTKLKQDKPIPVVNKTISYKPTETSSTNVSQLDNQQKAAVESLAKNLSKQRFGKGFKLY